MDSFLAWMTWTGIEGCKLPEDWYYTFCPHALAGSVQGHPGLYPYTLSGNIALIHRRQQEGRWKQQLVWESDLHLDQDSPLPPQAPTGENYVGSAGNSPFAGNHTLPEFGKGSTAAFQLYWRRWYGLKKKNRVCFGTCIGCDFTPILMCWPVVDFFGFFPGILRWEPLPASGFSCFMMSPGTFGTAA